MTDWHVGQKVVCVRWDWDHGPFEASPIMPVVGQTYTIRDIDTDPALPRCSFRFDEIINKPITFGTFLEPNFHCDFFRQIVETSADISAFESILNRVGKRVKVRA